MRPPGRAILVGSYCFTKQWDGHSQPQPMTKVMAFLCMQLPSVEEIVAHLQGHRLTTIVFFLDETFEEVAYDITTSVAEAVEQLAGLIRLQNYQTFTLYEAVRPVNPKLNPEPMPDEHLLLDEHRYV